MKTYFARYPTRRRSWILLITVTLLLPSTGLLTAGDGEALPPRRPGELRRQAIQQRIEALHEAGRHEEAEALAARLEQALEARELPPAGDLVPPERREAAERLRAMRREIAELRRAGAREEAERLMAEARELAGPAGRVGRFGPPGPDPDRPRPEMAERQRRAQHLRAAAENLAAIGMREQAEGLMREAEMTERPVDRPMPERELPWREMQEQLDQMRAALRELNARVDRLSQDR